MVTGNTVKRLNSEATQSRRWKTPAQHGPISKSQSDVTVQAILWQQQKPSNKQTKQWTIGGTIATKKLSAIQFVGHHFHSVVEGGCSRGHQTLVYKLRLSTLVCLSFVLFSLVPAN